MPTLKRSYDSKDAIPADIYIEKDGKFVLNSDFGVEGYVPSTTLDEFRNNNTRLMKEAERFAGIDPDKARTLIAKEQEILDAETKGAERISQRVEERIKDARTNWEKAEEKYKGTIGNLTKKLQHAVIEAKALELATPFGLRKDAARNLTLLVNETWTLDENGEPVAYESDGRTIKIDSQGKSMKGTDGLGRFVERLAKEDAKFLFEGNRGGGAQNDGGSGGGSRNNDDGEVNPFDPKTWNRTKQAEMVNADFDKARRMASRHGIDLKPSSLRKTA